MSDNSNEIRDLYSKMAKLESEQNSTGETKRSISTNLATILGSIATAAMIASAGFIYNSSVNIATMQNSIRYMSDQIQDLKSKVESMQANYVEKSDFISLEGRVRVLEARRR